MKSFHEQKLDFSNWVRKIYEQSPNAHFWKYPKVKVEGDYFTVDFIHSYSGFKTATVRQRIQ